MINLTIVKLSSCWCSYLKKPNGITNLRFKLPVKSSKYNVALTILGIGSLFLSELHAQSHKFAEPADQWIADRIFANECASKIECLTSWNPGEDFPSFGLGHFIWYRTGQQEIYQETFPDLLDFYHEQGIQTPNWITELSEADSPWLNREQFYAEFNEFRLLELREFLHRTMPAQARFITRRQELALARILEQAPESQREDLALLYRRIAEADYPRGRYALIDYINFKGEGIAVSERYQGQGWGLLQVLQTMLTRPTEPSVLAAFSDAAAELLQTRVANAPAERNEQRWLAGWLKRVETYRPAGIAR